MKANEINIRDPFVLLDDDIYYMYGTRGSECWEGKSYGLDVYVSKDLENWSEPVEVFTRPEDFWADRDFWAPEVHKYKGSYYMFVSFKCDGRCRGTQILKAESPMGPFLLHSDGPVTPPDWECLDGTLYVENDTPYMVFCHEWVQVKDGEMCAVELTKDLKAAVGEPVLLFKASEPAWAGVAADRYVTDGPFLYKTAGGRLIMIWSSLTDSYCEALSYSENGSLLGKWVHDERLLFAKDGGHGMFFHDLSGRMKFVCHQPNGPQYHERPIFMDIVEADGTLYAEE